MQTDRYEAAKALVIAAQKPSPSFVSRALGMPYTEAVAHIERMQADGLCSPANSAGKRMMAHGSPLPSRHTCKGSIRLGTGCLRCSRCAAALTGGQVPALRPMQAAADGIPPTAIAGRATAPESLRFYGERIRAGEMRGRHDLHSHLLIEAGKEVEHLRALVTRVTNAAEAMAAELDDPGTEALCAIHCGKNFIYG